ncbi:MAG: mechanosensitive ion channel family protein [Ruminococcaceae bacterium]|nr:mechanosensitive ion channel family protein [Oscillospiraceae bacterium]
MEAFLNKILEYLASAGMRVLCGIVVLIVGWIVINRVVKVFEKTKKIQKLDKTVRAFTKSALNIVLKTLLIIVVASIFGVPMTTFIAIITAASLAIGLALQGGLSNIAGGIILLIIKPFNIGDFVTIDGADGTVTDMNIFYTVLTTADGKRVDIPNGIAAGGKIVNYSVEKYRRIDISFVVPHGTDVSKIDHLLADMARSNSLIFVDDDHTPTVKVCGYEEDGLNINFRTWTENENYWSAFFAMNEGARLVFNANNIKLSSRQFNLRIEK